MSFLKLKSLADFFTGAARQTPNHRLELELGREKLNMRKIARLVEEGANVDLIADNYRTPLIAAVQENDADAFAYLIAAGADVNLRLPRFVSGSTALLTAAIRGHTRLAEGLVEAGADINAFESDPGWTPVVYAAMNKQSDTVEMLVKRGARLDLVSSLKGLRVEKVLRGYGYDALIDGLTEKAARAEAYLANGAPLGKNIPYSGPLKFKRKTSRLLT